jgi:integrase/recombinase XerD
VKTTDSGIISPQQVDYNTHIKEYIVIKRKENASDSYINGILRSLRVFFNFLYEQQVITKDLGSEIKLLKSKKKVVETFSKQQIKTLFRQPDLSTFTGVRDLTLMMLLLETGIRLSEVKSITINGINWHEGLVLVDGKGNKERQVPVQGTTLVQMKKYANIRGILDTTDVFFISIDNYPLSTTQIQKRIKDYGVQAGITNVRVSPHTFRHTFSKMYIQNGGDIFTLQKILGHTSLEMVRMYVNMFDTDVAKAHRKYSPIENLMK